jgi:hypothetical protein
MLERTPPRPASTSWPIRGVSPRQRADPGTDSGTSTPRTQYGSFDDPPSLGADQPAMSSPSKPKLCSVASQILMSAAEKDRTLRPTPRASPTLSARATFSESLSPTNSRQRDQHRAWSASTQRTLSKHASRHSLFVPSYTGLAGEVSADDIPSSDGEIFEGEDGDPSDGDHHGCNDDDQAKQYGVLKMETIARIWGRRGLMILYSGSVPLFLKTLWLLTPL